MGIPGMLSRMSITGIAVRGVDRGITIGWYHHRWHSVVRRVVPMRHTPRLTIVGVVLAWGTMLSGVLLVVMVLMLVSNAHFGRHLVVVVLADTILLSLIMVPAHRVQLSFSPFAVMLHLFFIFSVAISLSRSLVLLMTIRPLFADRIVGVARCLEQDLGGSMS